MLLILAISTAGWMTVVFDNYVVHIPYAWGRACIPCYNYIYYIYNFGYYVGYPGLLAASFFLVFLLSLTAIWLPRRGVVTTLLWTFLIVAPLCLFVFEIGAYFFLIGYWKVHATDFLVNTPFTNEVLFWTSGGVLAVGLCLEALRRYYRYSVGERPPAPASPSAPS